MLRLLLPPCRPADAQWDGRAHPRVNVSLAAVQMSSGQRSSSQWPMRARCKNAIDYNGSADGNPGTPWASPVVGSCWEAIECRTAVVGHTLTPTALTLWRRRLASHRDGPQIPCALRGLPSEVDLRGLLSEVYPRPRRCTLIGAFPWIHSQRSSHEDGGPLTRVGGGS